MEPFIHLSKYNTIVCSKCKHAVLATERAIYTHLSDKKKHGKKVEDKWVNAIPIEERRRIVQMVISIPGLKTQREQFNKAAFPSPDNPPIPELGPPRTTGLQCQFENEEGEQCRVIFCQVQKMQNHYIKEHNWENPREAGRPEINEKVQVPWKEGIHCQHFLVRGAGAEYFEVGRAEGPREARDEPGNNGFKSDRKEIEELIQKAEVGERVIKESDEAQEPNPWLNRVGWAVHFDKFDPKVVRKLVEQPGEEEEELQILGKAFKWLIQGAQYTAIRNVVGIHALFEANKKEVDKEPTMPFNSWMDITTVHSYVDVWERLLFYIWRVEEMEGEKPAYEMTEKQRIKFNHMKLEVQEFIDWKDEQVMDFNVDVPESEEEIKRMDQIQRKVLRFCVELLDQSIGDNEYESAIISGLAALGMREDNKWLDSEDYTPKYSAVIKLARLIVIQKAWEDRQKSIEFNKSRGDDHATAKRKAQSMYRLVGKSVEGFMTIAHSGRNPTPMHWIYNSRSYGFKIRYTTTAKGNIQWIGDDVLYPGIRFHMSKVRRMVHGIIHEAREVLFNDLIMVGRDVDGEVGSQCPPIDWDNIVDQPSESRVGWSFLDDERNKFAVDKQWWMFERVFKEQGLKEKFIDREGKWKETTFQTYIKSVERFKELMLLMMHLTGGQPARAPELLGIRWKNTTNGGIRNIFIEEGLVSFVAIYHKGYKSSGLIKIINRFLPREVGELLVYYLWLVVPFSERLEAKVTGSFKSNPFLWGDGEKKEHRRWTGPRQEKDEGYHSMDDISELGDDVHPEESPEQIQQRRLVAQRRGKAWTSERMRKIMKEASGRFMGVELNISAWRQIAIAISRRYCRQEDRFELEKTKLDDGEDWDEDNEEGDDPWDLQSGHGSHVAGMIYARELMMRDDIIIGRREKFRRVSHVWHCWLDFLSAQQGVGMQGRGRRDRKQYDEEMEEGQIARWKQMRRVDIHQALEIMLGENAEFRGLQEPAIRAIMKHESPILAVMGTGVGKSMLFMLPARSMSSGTTIVITPLVSLQDEMVERCQRANISTMKWDPRDSHQSKQIVIVTPESAVSKTFDGFLDRLIGLCQLDRIVIDECHTVLDSSDDFRPKMRQLGELIRKEVQMVYLTATLPPHREEEFMKIMRVKIDDKNKFRASTSRPNIEYSVLEYEGEEGDAVQELVKWKLEQYPAPAKIIVYSSSIDGIKELQKQLNCHVYYNAVGDSDAKKEIHKQWRSGDGRVILATNAFGLGIDEPDVRVVIHTGSIHQLASYGQESGRAGRDGNPCQAIVLVPEGKQEALKEKFNRERNRPAKRVFFDERDKGMMEWRKVEQFISGERCRRTYLDQEMDSRIDRVRCEGEEERCDVCQKDEAEIKEVEGMRQEYVQKEVVVERRRSEAFDSAIDIPTSMVRPRGLPSTMPSSIIRTPLNRRVIQTPVHFPSSVETPRFILGEVDGNTPMPDSERSDGSFDQGFTVPEIPRDTITEKDRAEFREQLQTQRRKQRLDIEEEREREGMEIIELPMRLDKWIDQCPICRVRKRYNKEKIDVQHTLEECRHPDREAVQKEVKALQSIQFDKFASCHLCTTPQRICSRWKEKYNIKGRFQWTNTPCQYKDIIRPAFAAMMIIGPRMVSDQVYQILKENRIWIEGKESINEMDEKEREQIRRAMIKWFGKGVQWGGVQASIFIQVFYKLVIWMEEYRMGLF